MGVRTAVARAVGLATSWGMRNVLHRSATTLPGRVGLALDPQLVGNLAPKLGKGSIVVCGTNGKTTTNNILAQVLEMAGMSVLCNRGGANMESGVAAALLPVSGADWGVFENDELSTARIVPALAPRYLVLLNLFRDQLDRCGELDRIQETIASALEASPSTVLVYNADDPLCEVVAACVRRRGAKTVPFGIDEDLHLPADRIAEGRFCPQCGAPLAYAYRQYGQLGSYACPACDFARPELSYRACDVSVGPQGVSFEVKGVGIAGSMRLRASWGGTYMVYNLLAAFAAARLAAGVDASVFQHVLDTYDPQNGRLQRFEVAGRQVTLNLAKNPTGFNQNMALLLQDKAPKIVYIAINDGYNDGRDVSWLWDVDFEHLLDAGETRVFVGGTRANDMQVRLKYAGLAATVANGVEEVLAATGGLGPAWHVWVLTNYSALWSAKAELERMGASR